MGKHRQYYSLLARDYDELHPEGIWGPQWGSWIKKEVTSEAEEYRREYRRKDLRTITTDGTQVDCDRQVAELNKAGG